MILYRLKCACEHEFDSWFRNSATYDRQAGRGVLQCPVCGSNDVCKAIMAPRINRTDSDRNDQSAPLAESAIMPLQDAVPSSPVIPDLSSDALAPDMRTMLRALRQKVEAECTYVGSDFAKHARAIAEGESEPQGIYGEATPEEAQDLHDDGIEIAQIPWLPPHDA